MVAVAVVAILITAALPSLLGAKQRSRDGAARTNLRNVISVASAYGALNNGQWPNAAALGTEDTSLSYVDAVTASTGPRTVSIYRGASRFVAAVRSESGNCIATEVRQGASPTWTSSAGAVCNAGGEAGVGLVTTLAGSGGTGHTDGTGTAAAFAVPSGLDVDQSGNVYVADYANNRIRVITPAGAVTTFAGSGNFAYADGTGTAASFKWPSDVALDSSGNLFVSDQFNHRIRKINPNGVVTTFAGSGALGTADGTGTAAQFFFPQGIAVDSNDNVFVTDGPSTIRKITPAGVVTTFAGSPNALGSTDGVGPAASFSQPLGLTLDASDNIYVADSASHMIRKITPAGTVTTLAGSGAPGGTDDSGTAATFNHPYGIAFDGIDALYVAEGFGHVIRKVTLAGVVTTLAGSVAGFADGIGEDAQFSFPSGLAYDVGAGALYIADKVNNRIRKLTE